MPMQRHRPWLGSSGCHHDLIAHILPTILCRYINRYFRSVPGFSLKSLMPMPATILGCAAASAAVWVSCRAFMLDVGAHTHTRTFLQMAGLHIAVGGAVLALLGAVVYKAEDSTFRAALSLRKEGGEGDPVQKGKTRTD